MSASPSQPPPPTCPLCPNSKADFSNPQILKTHNLTRHNLVYKSTVYVGLGAFKTELVVHRPSPTGSLACPSPKCSSTATLGHNLKAHIEHCDAARIHLGGVKKGKPPVQPPPSASTSSIPRPPSSLPNFKRKEAPSTSSPYANHHASSSQQPSASPSADGQQRKRARVSLAARSTEPETEMEVDANEPTDDTVDPKWYTLEMGSELMWAVVNLKDKNGIPLASEFFVYPDFDVYIDYLSVIPDAFTLKDVQDHLDIGNHASLYYVKRYIDRCFKQARDYFPPEHRLHKAAVELTAIVKQTYDYLPFAADASPSPTALIYGKPTPFVVRPPRPFTDEGFDHLVQFVADKIHRTNALLNKRSIHGFPPDFFDELASQDIPSSTWYLFYVKATKSFRSSTMPMAKAIRLALTKLQGDENAGGQDAAAVAPVGGGAAAAAAPAAGPSAPAAPPPMFGSPRPRPPPVASNGATPASRPLHPSAVPSTSTPSSKPPITKVSTSASNPPPTLDASTPNGRAFGAAPTPKQVGWLSGLLTSAIAEASPALGPANATPPPDRIPIVHRTPQPFPGLSSYTPSDAPSPPSELAAPLHPPSPAPSRPASSISTVNESQPTLVVAPQPTVDVPQPTIAEAQAPNETDTSPRAPSPSPPPSSTQAIPSSSTPMDISETAPIAASKHEGQDPLDELLLLSQGAASHGIDTSDDDDDDDDDGVDLTQMSHNEWMAYLKTKGPPRPSTTASTPSPIPTLAANAASAPPRPALISTESTTLRLDNTRLTTRNSELKTCLDDLSEKMKKGEEEHASEIQSLHAALATRDAQLAVAQKEKEDAEVDWKARFARVEEEKAALELKWKAKEAEVERKAEERRAALAALMGTL